MTGHAIGTHDAALRLALGLDELPDVRHDESVMRSRPFEGQRILDLACGQHPFPWVAGGPEYLVGRQFKATVDLPGEPETDDPHLWRDEHIADDFNDPQRLDELRGCAPFDLVVALEIIEHVENPWDFIRLIARWLAPGGRAVLSSPDITSTRARTQFLQSGELPYFPTGGDFGLGHITPILPGMLAEMARRAGLRITAETTNEPPPHWLETATPDQVDGIAGAVRVWRLEHE